jgi:hypothetical protein
MVHKMALGQVFLQELPFSPVSPLQQGSTLIFIYMLHLLEGQTVEAWVP